MELAALAGSTPDPLDCFLDAESEDLLCALGLEAKS